ncbi:MAG: prepilin peptidase [Planctomycetia bacterium]
MILVDLPRFFVLPCLFIIGCCIGSFLNVCIHRFPSRHRLIDQLKSLNSHGSGCPKCSVAIRWYDNVPLFGWLLLRGRCRNCRLPISPRYPLVELLTGILFVALFQLEMPSNFWGTVDPGGLYTPDGPQNLTTFWPAPVWLHVRYALHIAMICCLIVATFIDLELWIIPDGSTVPMMLLALLVAGTFGQAWIVPVWFQDASVVSTLRSLAPDWMKVLLFSWDSLPFAIAFPHLHGFLVSAAGLIVGGGVVWVVRILGAWVLKREAMGFGDVVLMAMVGSVIGWQPVLVVFFLAPIPAISVAVLSLIFRRRDEIPYGPWLSLATFLLLAAWKTIWPIAERIFDMGPFVLLMGLFMFVMLFVSLHLSQIVRKLLGFRAADPGAEPVDDGIPVIYPSDRSDPGAGQWDRPLWPGQRAGQGLAGYSRWRHGRND